MVGSGATVQVTPKSTWPDGSLRIGVVSGSAALVAGSPLTVTLAAGTAAGGTALTTANLKATGIVALVGCGSFGAVSWSGVDWDSPFNAWVSGPQMSSWIYRKAVGTDAHLVAWLEVRLFANGAVEVLPWVENGYLYVANPSSKSATYSFTLGGTQRFSAAIDLPARARTVLLSGTALSHWLGNDPDLNVKHDTAYLQATLQVPTYGATVAATSPLVASLPGSFTPLQRGNYMEPMSNTGYAVSIGLLPQWDVLYLTSNAGAAYAGLIRNAYSAGRLGIHYRDEATNRPLRFSQRTNTSVNSSDTGDYPAAATGTAAPAWDTGHHPSVGFMAYLVTGRFYFMEQLQFAATFNYLKQVSGGPYGNRNGPNGPRDGIFYSASGGSTVRGASWSLRTLAQVACATPDDDLLKPEFVASLEANINWNHARYVAVPNNPFGIVEPYASSYGSADGHLIEAFWQQDFYTQACGYMLAMDPPIQAAVKTRLQAFFAWKAQSVVGRLGAAGSGNWLYCDAANYNSEIVLTGANWVSGAGPWPTSWGEMYGWNFTTPNTTDAGVLRGGNFPGAASYWGNLTPALAFAVQHGVGGAAAAFQRMIGASNYATLSADYNGAPEWSVIAAAS